MSGADEPKGGRGREYAETLLKTAVLAVPMGLITLLGSVVQGRMVSAPWVIAWVAVPLVAAGWLTLRLYTKHRFKRNQWPWLVCLVAYGCVFAIASVSDALVWRQVPRDPQGIAQREWLLPVRAGDWRYWVAPKARARAQDVIAVLMEPEHGPDARMRLRTREAALLRLVVSVGEVRGFGMDLFFEEHTSADEALCAAVDAARAALVPVWSGYTYQYTPGGRYVERPATPALPCLLLENQGHLIAFADTDGRVRAVKTYYEGMLNRPAFSVRAAHALMSSYKLPDVALPAGEAIWFLPPSNPVDVISDVEAVHEPELLRGKLVMLGLHVRSDRARTPFGEIPGTLVHAYALHSLVSGRMIIRPAPWWSVACVFCGCYLLILLALMGWSTSRLALAAAGLSLAVIALAAVAMRGWLVWLPVVYAITAMWLLLPVLAGLRGKLGVGQVEDTEELKFVN